MALWWRKQKAGSGSQQIQADTVNVTNNAGLTYADIKELCEDVVRADVERYSQEGLATLIQRFEEFIENYLTEQSTRNPDGFSSLRRPSMQRALRTAQIEFGTSGEPEVGELLVDLLIELADEDENTVIATCLIDALEVARKLNDGHLAILTTILILRITRMNSLGNPEMLYAFLRKELAPIGPKLPSGSIPYRHMQYLGLGWFNFGSEGLSEALIGRFQGLFTEGFSSQDIPPDLQEQYPAFFVRAIRNDQLLQLNSLNDSTLEIDIQKFGISPEDSKKFHSLLAKNLMAPDQVTQELLLNVPEMEAFYTNWQVSNIDGFELTTLGITIAQANWRRVSAQALDLSIYLPEPRASIN